jgi:hypothetical protein
MTVADNMVRVTFPVPFATNTTAFYPGNSGIGVSYFTVQNLVKKNSFKVFDSIGPVIVSATAVERLKTGVDTLYISFSEALQPQTIVGASLILIKNHIPSTLVVDAYQQISGGVYVVSLTTSSVQPEAGDSLRINPEGPLRDQLGNRAHLFNRPVILGSKEIPPNFVSAYYVDRDSGIANGVVDAAILKFNKRTDISGLTLLFDWGSNYPQSTILSADMAYLSPTDSTIVFVNLKTAFPTRPPLKTSGDMFVTSQWKKFPTLTDNIKVQDSAAPVIAEASYLLSAEIGNFCDTLIVSFSEPSSIIPDQNIMPFKLFSRGGGLTSMPLVSLIAQQNSDTLMRFCVSADQITAVIPKTGDSLWINPIGNVKDKPIGIVQMNERNKKVALKVIQPNSDLSVKILWSPFTPGSVFPGSGFVGTAISISTNNPKAKLPIMTGSLKVYDLLGNLVHDDYVAQRNEGGGILGTCYYFTWDGRNKNDRFVGTGTYNFLLNYTVEGWPPEKKWKSIGVRR